MKKLSVFLIIFLLLFTACDEIAVNEENNEGLAQKTASPSPNSSTASDKDAPGKSHDAPAVSKAPTNGVKPVRIMKTVTVDKTDEKKPIVTFTLGNDKVIKAELYPDVAPITVENFIKLIDSEFYDGLTFHRIEPGFVIQGGDPKGNGTGGPGWNIKGEFSSNGVKNDLKHERGVLSMARSGQPDSAGSQFFIMHDDAPHLDGSYAAFGMVIEGIEVVDEVVASK